MMLARDEGTSLRLYSLSATIRSERDSYYAALKRAQHGDGDISEWQVAFLEWLERAMHGAEHQLDAVLAKARFWQRHAGAGLSERQRKVVNRLLDAEPDGFEGGLTTRKFVGMAKVSRATAQREIADLVAKGLLTKRPGGGRSTSYDIVLPSATPS